MLIKSSLLFATQIKYKLNIYSQQILPRNLKDADDVERTNTLKN